MSSQRPAWLLAVVFVTAVTAVVILSAMHVDESIHDVLELVVPVLTALFILDRVDRNAGQHDQKLEKHAEKLDQVSTSVNGNLTARLEAAVAPIREELAQLRAQVTLTDEEAAGDVQAPKA